MTTEFQTEQQQAFGLEDTGLVGNTLLQSTQIQRSATGGSIMGVGGGVHDEAVDVTYSTKPDKPTMAQGALQTTTTTSTTEYGLGGAEIDMTQGADLGATIGNTINLGTTTTNMEFGATTTTESTGYEFGAGEGAAIETTGVEGYDANVQIGEGAGLEVNQYGTAGLETYTGGEAMTTTTTTTTQYGMGMETGTATTEGAAFSGSVMGVGGGVHDEAVDVTYSTKSDQVTNLGTVNLGTVNLGTVDLGTTVVDQGTTVVKRKSITIPGGIASLAKTTTSTVGVDIKSLNIYNRTTLLQDQVQHIIKREIQPIVKTIIKPILQKEVQPIVQREIQPIVQKEVQPIVQKEIQPIIQKEIQPIVKREVQPIIQKEVQPIVKKEIQPILMREEKP